VVSGAAATPDNQGYVMVSAAGQIYACGNAAYRGGSDKRGPQSLCRSA
jgi:hypothetical protein